MREGSDLAGGLEAAGIGRPRPGRGRGQALRSLAAAGLGVAAALAFWIAVAILVPALGGSPIETKGWKAKASDPRALPLSEPGIKTASSSPGSPGASGEAHPGAKGEPGDAPRKGLSGIELVRFTAEYLRPEALKGVGAQAAAKRAGAWVAATEAAGGDPLAAVDEILPRSAWFQARLIHDRDEDDLESAAAEPGQYGGAYSAIQGELGLARSSAAGVEAALGAVWAASSFPKAGSRLAPPVSVSARWLPEVSEMESSHRYALDVFFKSVRRWGAAETGPAIHSVTDGIVVSAAGDWKGGDSPSSYRSGGLSPKAGNGAIVYDPGSRRYYAYFHLSEVRVRPGQAVKAGDQLGRGGNTGVNARKKGHGAHVHLEIHEADGDAWTSYSIRDLVSSLR